jgi:hypothetical protein
MEHADGQKPASLELEPAAPKSIDAIVDARDDDFVFDELTGEIADEICKRHVKHDPESEKHEDIKDIIRDRLAGYRNGKPLEYEDDPDPDDDPADLPWNKKPGGD